jgi:hypothetical protein
MRAQITCAPGVTQERRSEKRRAGTLRASRVNGFDGKPIAAMEKKWSKSKRFKVARLAKANDVDSNFSPGAV